MAKPAKKQAYNTPCALVLAKAHFGPEKAEKPCEVSLKTRQEAIIISTLPKNPQVPCC
jgi:hypothetical protein